MDDGQHRTAARSGKVIKRLLLDTEREPHGKADRDLVSTVSHISAQGVYIRDQKLALDVVVRVVAHSARQDERALYIPTRRDAKIKTSAGKKCLCNCVLRVLNSPGTQVFGQDRGGQTIAEFMLQPRIGRRVEILLHHRAKQQIARGISRDQRGSAPRPSDRELDIGKQIARMEILINEGAGFSLGTACYRDPVEKWTGVKVQELSKQVLTHEHRGNGVAAQRELQSPVEGDGVCTQMQNRIDSTVHDGVVSISILNHSYAWIKQAPGSQTLPDKT